MPKSIILYPNGTISAYDEQEEHITELNLNWIILYLERIEQMGYKPEEFTLEIRLNDGSWGYAVPFKTPDGGWNYEIKPKQP